MTTASTFLDQHYPTMQLKHCMTSLGANSKIMCSFSWSHYTTFFQICSMCYTPQHTFVYIW